MRNPHLKLPSSGPVSHVAYRVPFYDTDAMGIVHHANYVRYLELSRVRFLEDFDEPYTAYIKQKFHVVVTRVDVKLKRATRFDEQLDIACWLQRVGGATLVFGYQINCGNAVSASAITEHGIVNFDGRAMRLPEERRTRLSSLVIDAE